MSELTRRSFLKTTTAAGLASLPAARVLATPSSEDPLGIRGQFPVTNEMAYLNTASVGPLSRTAHNALAAYADDQQDSQRIS